MNSWNLVRYYDPKTFKKKDLRILEDIAADWEVIGEILGFRPPRIKAIRCAGAGKTPAQCLRGVLTRWMVNANVMPNSDRYPSTWQGLHNLLVDSLHGATAKDLTDAIDTPYSDLHSNFDKGNSQKLDFKIISLPLGLLLNSDELYICNLTIYVSKFGISDLVVEKMMTLKNFGPEF